LLNLCLNARDAMPNGGTLLLRTAAAELAEPLADHHFQAGPGRYVVFSVSDTGQGMSADAQRHVYEPFFTTKGLGKGTGLGLSLAYGVLQQHKGAIQFHSRPGEGTTFDVYVPCGSQAPETAAAAPRQQAPRGKETILVAEDEPLVRDLAVRVLRHSGYTVLTAADGAEALRAFQEHCRDISLVILDAVLPKLSGREVCARIKTGRPDAKVLFASGYDPETAQSDFIAEQRLRLIEKPFTADALLRAVREVLDEVQPCLQLSS
jgi:CheY-like chemotaxis protein